MWKMRKCGKYENEEKRKCGKYGNTEMGKKEENGKGGKMRKIK